MRICIGYSEREWSKRGYNSLYFLETPVPCSATGYGLGEASFFLKEFEYAFNKVLTNRIERRIIYKKIYVKERDGSYADKTHLAIG
jgi:hypothetical protein